MKTYERRYHATWLLKNGLSPLAELGLWVHTHPGQLARAPSALLQEAAVNVATRLPQVAAREPIRRHRKHFAWLLRWHVLITNAQKSSLRL